MKRLHIHINVENLAESILFYNALFGMEASKTKDDYAKWMVDDPCINFAISTRGGEVGIDHLGIQVDEASELNALRDQISAANISTHSDGESTCCYAKSEKSWVKDPNGIAWEAYHTMEDAQTFSGKPETITTEETAGACCVPKAKAEPEKKTACCG
jgi:catechol-2,3-dioxygenase